jgi:hypothetical protein
MPYLKYTIILRLQKTAVCSFCTNGGGPKMTAVLKSPQITESSAPLYNSGKPALHVDIEHESMTKDRFLKISKTLRYYGK